MEQWLADLAARVPAPGGGAAAALNAAVSAALLGMVSAYTTGPKWSDREDRMRELNALLSEHRYAAINLADADELAFKRVGEAYTMPKATDEEKAARREAIQHALVNAAEPPARVGELVLALLHIAGELAEDGNPNVLSDVAVAVSNARAALESAIVNVAINRGQIKDSSIRDDLDKAIDTMELATRQCVQVTRTIREKIG